MPRWLALTVFAFTLGIPTSARQAPTAGYEPPGAMIEVGGGRRLHLVCTGRRGPTVVIEAGSGDFSFDWALVQGPVAKFVRVCSYDRAGYAWSDPGPTPRTFRQIALELHTALERAHIPGPYVLVGHSYGGVFVPAFSKYYPHEIVGVGLAESMHQGSRGGIGGGPPLPLPQGAERGPVPQPRPRAPLAAG